MMERFSGGNPEGDRERLDPSDSDNSNIEQMGESLVVAFDWALGPEHEHDPAEVVAELYTYAACLGELSNKEIDALFGEALKEGE